MKVNWQGVYPAISRQFNDDVSINYGSNTHMLEDVINDSIDGIPAPGTIGEDTSFNAQEKRDFIKPTVEALGLNGLMLLSTIIYRGTERKVITHFQTVASSTQLLIMIYNNPVSYRVDINLEMTAIPANEANSVTIKESTTDTRRITQLRCCFGDRFTIFCGVDDIALESTLLRATGWISGLTNVFPRESVTLFRLAFESRIAKAREIYRRFMPLPRICLIGEKYAYVGGVVAQASAKRLNLSKYI